MTAREIKRCQEDFTYWYRHCYVPVDKNGNKLFKPNLTDNQLNRMAKLHECWLRVRTRYPLTGKETTKHINALLERINEQI